MEGTLANAVLVIGLLAIYLLTCFRIPERIANFNLFRIALYLVPANVFFAMFLVIGAISQEPAPQIIFAIFCYLTLVGSLACYLLAIKPRPPGRRRGSTGQVPVQPEPPQVVEAVAAAPAVPVEPVSVAEEPAPAKPKAARKATKSGGRKKTATGGKKKAARKKTKSG